MSRIYQVSYTDKAVANARAPLSVAANKMVSFQIPFPSEGFLTGFTVYQLTGTSVAFSADLFTSSIPYPPGEYATNANPAAPVDPFRVQIPNAAITATAGNVANLVTDNMGCGYKNMDGNASNEQRFLYLLIKPTGANGTTTWAVYLEVRTEPRE